jgi:hypothetical protein
MRAKLLVRSVLFSLIALLLSHAAQAQFGIGISVNFGPPPLPVYEQPICPADGYLWTPGYWAWDPDYGYFWVPGTWVEAPQVGFLWTPGYWGWGGNAFVFNEGYWGPQVGFYGGINYGFGYVGNGYEGGRWDGGHFSYNTYVNHVNTTVIHNTYNTTVINNVTVNHVSYNGGTGGVESRPTAQEQSYASQRHLAPVAAQTQHVQAARSNPELRATANQGKPPIAATARPGDFKTGVVEAKEAGGEYKAPPKDAGELQGHKYTAPASGDADKDKANQAEQDKLAAQQTQEHQQLQKQQEQEHQAAAQKNYSAEQQQQLERQHAQQTQQLEQKHTAEQQQLQKRQAPPPQRESAPRESEKKH